MADFVQTMKDWSRMCTWMHDEKDGCKDCTLHHDELCKGPWDFKTDDYRIWELLLERITKWAEEHPEPVYPTWLEYLTDMYHATWYMTKDEPIPADIAQKLGLRPKE